MNEIRAVRPCKIEKGWSKKRLDKPCLSKYSFTEDQDFGQTVSSRRARQIGSRKSWIICAGFFTRAEAVRKRSLAAKCPEHTSTLPRVQNLGE